MSTLPPKSTVFFVTFEGNIGSGKSTLMQQVYDVLRYGEADVILANEPVEQWLADGLLQDFGRDPRSAATRFQFAVFNGRLKWEREIMADLASKQGSHIVLCERSSDSDAIFANLNRHLGRISENEIQEYRSRAASVGPRVCPDMCVLLVANPEFCTKNIKHRGRAGEQDLSLGYISAINSAHESFDWSHGGMTEMAIVLKTFACVHEANIATTLSLKIASRCDAKSKN
jgi:thymidylate kinase